MQKLYKLVLVHFSSTENEVLQLIKIHPYSFLLLLGQLTAKYIAQKSLDFT